MKSIRLYLGVGILVFLTMSLLNVLSKYKVFTAFDVFGQALSDFELTDYAFNTIREDSKPERHIVVVNISNLSRRDIAREINIIAACQPRVLGVDAFFNCEGGLYDTLNCPQLVDVMGNALLAKAIQNAGNVVLSSKLMQSIKANAEEDEYDSLEVSDAPFLQHAHTGFANVPTGALHQEDVKICRTFWPYWMLNGKEYNAFSTEIVRLYDSTKYQKLKARKQEEEVIYFRGNIDPRSQKTKSTRKIQLSNSSYTNRFFAIDANDLLRGHFEPTLFKDKIVLLGFLGNNFDTPAYEDKFFTPLNSKMIGRAHPDMYGVVIHANIVSMMLNEDYVNELPNWAAMVIAIIVGMLTTYLLVKIDTVLPIWYDALSVVVQLIELVVLMGVVVFVFAKFAYKLDITLTFAVVALVGPCYDVYKGIENQFFTSKS